METKVIIKGVNAYGYKFEIPGYLPEHLYKFNLHNYKRANSFMVEVKSLNNEGEVVSKSINFGSACFNLPLNSNSLYWTEIQFEDGSVLHNEHEQELIDAARINKLSYEFNHKSKFDDELNKYVGRPIFCEKKSGEGMTQGGLLLSVNPAKADLNIVCVNFGSGTFFMHIKDENNFIVYEDKNGELERVATIESSKAEGQKSSQPGNVE